MRLTYVQEDVPLGTGGAIRNVAGHLAGDPDGAVVILNGDVLSGHCLRAQLADFTGRARAAGPTSPCTWWRSRTPGFLAAFPPTWRVASPPSWRSPSTR